MKAYLICVKSMQCDVDTKFIMFDPLSIRVAYYMHYLKYLKLKTGNRLKVLSLVNSVAIWRPSKKCFIFCSNLILLKLYVPRPLRSTTQNA